MFMVCLLMSRLKSLLSTVSVLISFPFHYAFFTYRRCILLLFNIRSSPQLGPALAVYYPSKAFIDVCTNGKSGHVGLAGWLLDSDGSNSNHDILSIYKLHYVYLCMFFMFNKLNEHNEEHQHNNLVALINTEKQKKNKKK